MLARDQGLRQALKWPPIQKGSKEMDYIIAGMASVLLFVYLLYALLKPERF
jgi:K+-transporting ATPase KdpF subunit